MKSFILCVFLSGICTLYISSMKELTGKGEVPYPVGYREWTHVKTAITGPSGPASHSGFHHIYANGKAMEGYRTGKFPEGSILVFDVVEALTQPNGNVKEGERKLVDVMIKESKSYDSTGGWGFEEFKGSSISERSILHLSKSKCFNCHETKKQNDFVFSAFRK